MKDTEIEYQERLNGFEKYKRNGVDLAFRCGTCGKLVVNSDIIYPPHGCRKCGQRKLYPITTTLTWFGILYCRFWSWFHAIGKEIDNGDPESSD